MRSIRQTLYLPSDAGKKPLNINQKRVAMEPVSSTKELLLMLYERKDVKRRRFLYKHYENLFAQYYSMDFLVDLINEDLGKALVSASDIKYIRANAYKWKSELIPPDVKNTDGERQIQTDTGGDPDLTTAQTG
jgi:hypothetical protein